MSSLPEHWTFGPFEFSPGTGEVWSGEHSLKLARQPCLVLAAIVRAGGALVTKDQLRTAVWADGTTVDFDQGLNYCVRQIRIALDDDGRHPKYVETLPKRGYRLLVPATLAADQKAAPIPSWRDRARRYMPLTVTAVSLLAAGAVLVGHLTAIRAPSPEAYRLFLEAQRLAESWDPDIVADAVARYKRVLQLEPRFAPAWAALANADVVMTFVGPQPARALADSETHARRALELDGSLSVARAALGHSYWFQWRWHEAEEQFRIAIANGDDVAIAHQLFGLYLASVGRPEEAIDHARRAVALAPVSGDTNFSLAWVYLHTGHFEDALAQARRTLELDRHYPIAYDTLVRANSRLGRLAEAAAAVDAATRYSPDSLVPAWRAYLLALQGNPADARMLLADWRAHRARPSGAIAEASAWVAIGDTDAAFRSLDESVTAHVSSLVWLRVAPELASLRADARFGAVLRRMHASPIRVAEDRADSRVPFVPAFRVSGQQQFALRIAGSPKYLDPR